MGCGSSGQSTEPRLATLAALSPHGPRLDDSHACGGALRRQEKRRSVAVEPVEPASQQTAMPGQTHLRGSSGIWAPERTWVCPLELVRQLSTPQTLSHTPEPDDVLCDV